MKNLLNLSLLILLIQFVWAYPTGSRAKIVNRGKSSFYHDSVALFSPTPLEKSRIGGPKDLPVLALYFFSKKLSLDEKRAFGAAISANRHGTGNEYPYGILELGLDPRKPFGPEGILVFNMGSCSGESSYGVGGAMLTYPDHRAQWKMNFNALEGEIKDGGNLHYDIRLENIATHYSGEFSGNAPVLIVAKSKYELFP
ncbi:MAG: hypothetical protein U0931_05375 [Vulcanimicrobiota bacterium]